MAAFERLGFRDQIGNAAVTVIIAYQKYIMLVKSFLFLGLIRDGRRITSLKLG